ncbi:MAG: hypothetical protein H6619_03870 [Deltaproteobacteria bacterium]|nr:hypothetical protein [Deltaproteobacteria bacterium]
MRFKAIILSTIFCCAFNAFAQDEIITGAVQVYNICGSIKAELKLCKADKADLMNELALCDSKKTVLEDQLNSCNIDKAAAEAEVLVLESELLVAQEDLSTCQADKDSFEQSVNTLTADLASLQLQLAEKAQELQAANSVIANNSTQISSLTEQLSSCEMADPICPVIEYERKTAPNALGIKLRKKANSLAKIFNKNGTLTSKQIDQLISIAKKATKALEQLNEDAADANVEIIQAD